MKNEKQINISLPLPYAMIALVNISDCIKNMEFASQEDKSALASLEVELREAIKNVDMETYEKIMNEGFGITATLDSAFQNALRKSIQEYHVVHK